MVRDLLSCIFTFWAAYIHHVQLFGAHVVVGFCPCSEGFTAVFSD